MPRTDPTARIRAALVALAVALVVVVVIVAVRAGSGSSVRPPETGAAEVVPADALAYINLSIDPSRTAVKRALAVAARFPDYPLLSAAITARLSAIAGGAAPVSFAQDIRPWLGHEAALALLNTSTSTAGSLIVLEVATHRQALAHAFLSKSGAVAGSSYRGVRLYSYRTGTELAFVRRYLVFGQDASVRASIDVATGAAPSLQASSAYRAAAAGEPADRVLDAYASAAGVRRILTARGGVIGAFGALLYDPALTAATLSVSADRAGARVQVHTVLDPTLARLSGTGTSPFTPTLQGELPAGSAAMLDVTDLARSMPHLLAAGQAGGVGGRIAPLLSRLGAALGSEGVNVADIVRLFSGETAVAIAPHAGAPSLIIVTKMHDESATASELAALALPLEQLFPTPTAGPGQAPVTGDRELDGVTVQQLSLAPGLELDYAVFRGMLVVSTSLDGLDLMIRRPSSLGDTPLYRTAVGGIPERVTSLLFLDFSQLLSLGEQTGLTRGTEYRALRPDLEKIRAIGLDSAGGEADTTAELYLQIP